MQAHYYIAFSILSSIGRPELQSPGDINIANTFVDYFYLLSLGNRPQGAIIGFGLITIFMTVSALLLAFKGLDILVKEHKGSLSLGDFFSNAIFRNIVLSLAATLGIYVFASLIFVSRVMRVSLFFSFPLTHHTVRPLAFDHFFRSVHVHGTLLYQRAQRIRRP